MSPYAPSFVDVLIVGAGPAGSHLACQLARQGMQVAIIDKAVFPREKVCGGGLSRKALDLLDFDLGPVMHQPISGALIAYRNRDMLTLDVDPAAGCMVTRSEFDHLLLERAGTAGARFMPDTGFVDAEETKDDVTVKTTHGTIRCRILVGADGAASTVRARMFGKDVVHYVPALEALLVPSPGTPHVLKNRALFDFGVIPRGYGWIFPKRDHLNVGVYSPEGGSSLHRYLKDFMAQYDCLRQPSEIRYQGYVIPIRNLRKQFQKGRVWLLGDAAGLAETLFGEGIYFALKSAELAARAIKEEGLRPGSRRYASLLHRELLPELRAARWLATGIYRFPELTFRHLVHNRRVNRDFARIISGELSYRSCLMRTAIRFPWWLRQTMAATPQTLL